MHGDYLQGTSAATAAVVIAATAVVATAEPIPAEAEEDDDQNDDPQTATATTTVITASHKCLPPKKVKMFESRKHRASFHPMREGEKGAKEETKKIRVVPT